jgi:anaerobic C4-dicarboxylate transporter DcuA
MVWIEFAVVLGAIFLGSRVGGVGLGLMAMIGLAVLVFAFGAAPSSPPGTVVAIVVAVVCAASALQAAGGMDLLVTLAERLLRKKPEWITFAGPLVAYVFTFCSGTGHVAYAILPIIAEVARKAGVRPERPLSISVIASQQAITASPLAAATVGLLGIFTVAGLEIGGQKVQLWHILAICIPSTLIGSLVGAIAASFMGKRLEDDPIYLDRMAKGLIQTPKPAAALEGVAKKRAMGSVGLFLLAATVVVSLGMFESLRPTYVQAGASGGVVPIASVEAAVSDLLDPERATEVVTREEIARVLETTVPPVASESRVAVGMPTIIQIVMYSAAGFTLLWCGATPGNAIKTPVATAGVVAVISIVGLGWLGNCFFDGNKDQIVGALSDVIRARPWIFAIGLFALSIVLFSQASTVAALMPLGIALGIPAGTLIAMFPAVNGYFFLPTYGTIVAAVAFDSTGTTRIGKYVLNHSFMIPGLVTTTTSVLIGLLMQRVLFG